MNIDWVAVGSVGTLLAVVAALAIAIWSDWLRALASKPELTLSISMQAPDCHRIQTTQQALTPNGRLVTVAVFDTYYFRLSVGNGGNTAARNVGVRAIKLSKQNGTAWKDDPYFMPMDLTWSHANGSTIVAKIDPKLPKHCDLAHVDQPTPGELQFNTEVVPNEVAPGIWPTKKPPGTYQLRVAVTADNSGPVYRTLKIVFDGNWYATEKDMFEKGAVISVEQS